MRIRDAGINYRRTGLVSRGRAAGHSATVAELPCAQIYSVAARTQRSKQVEERTPTSPKSAPRRCIQTNTRCTEVSVYTVAGVDNTRRLHSAFSQLFLGHVDRSNECLPTFAGVQFKDELARSLANKWNYHSKRASCETQLRELGRSSFFFVCHVKWCSRPEPSMYLERPVMISDGHCTVIIAANCKLSNYAHSSAIIA